MKAAQLRKFLEREKLTQAQLAQALDVSERTVRRYLAEQEPLPRILELALLGLQAQGLI